MSAPAPILCGRCAYDVRGLPGRVCPECGSDLRIVGFRRPGVIPWPRPRQAFYVIVAVLLPLLGANLAVEWLVTNWSPTEQHMQFSEAAYAASDSWPALIYVDAGVKCRIAASALPPPLSDLQLKQVTVRLYRFSGKVTLPDGSQVTPRTMAVANISLPSTGKAATLPLKQFTFDADSPPDADELFQLFTTVYGSPADAAEGDRAAREASTLLAEFAARRANARGQINAGFDTAWQDLMSGYGSGSSVAWSGLNKYAVLPLAMLCWAAAFYFRPRRLFSPHRATVPTGL